jgi:hypothetical protein
LSRLSGMTAVVGAADANSKAGAAYIYVNSASRWPTTPTTTLLDPGATAGDSFGVSVAVQSTVTVVGAAATSSQPGAAYMYVRQALTWPATPTTTLSDPAPTANDDFGYSRRPSGPPLSCSHNARLCVGRRLLC